MWVAAQIMELTATAVYGTPLSRPIRKGVEAVALMSIAPAIIASRPSLPRKNFLDSTSSPTCLKNPCRIAMTSGAPMIDAWTPSRILSGFCARAALSPPRIRASAAMMTRLRRRFISSPWCGRRGGEVLGDRDLDDDRSIRAQCRGDGVRDLVRLLHVHAARAVHLGELVEARIDEIDA